jgi:hypothetical protein
MRLFSDARNALFIWLKSPSWFILSVILDLLFMIVYGFVTAPIKGKIVEHVLVIGGLISQAAQESGEVAVQKGQSIIALMLERPEVSPYFHSLLLLFVILAVASFVTYILFQACVWFLAHRRASMEMDLPEFISRFASLNIWWGILVMLYSAVTLIDSIRIAVTNSQSDLFSQSLMVLAVIVGVVASWTYALPMRQSGWRGAIDGSVSVFKRWKVTLPATLLVIVGFVLLNYAIMGIANLSTTAAFIAGIVLLFPIMAWARLFMVESARHHVDA